MRDCAACSKRRPRSGSPSRPGGSTRSASRPGSPRDRGVGPVVAGEVIRVGPAEPLTSPAAAAGVAKDGAVIEIAAGDYDGEGVTWTQNNLTLRGRNGRPRLRLTGPASSDSAIWVLRGERTVVENMDFAGAAGGAAGGTGIRLESGDLTVRGTSFHGNARGVVATGRGTESRGSHHRLRVWRRGHGQP